MTSEEIAKALRRAARKLHAGMPRGGHQGTKKGKRGYRRREKHQKRPGEDAG